MVPFLPRAPFGHFTLPCFVFVGLPVSFIIWFPYFFEIRCQIQCLYVPASNFKYCLWSYYVVSWCVCFLVYHFDQVTNVTRSSHLSSVKDGRMIEPRDPRPRYQRICYRRQASDLPVPRWKVCILCYTEPDPYVPFWLTSLKFQVSLLTTLNWNFHSPSLTKLTSQKV